MNQNLNITIHEEITPEVLTALDTALGALEHAAEFTFGLGSRDRARLRAFGPANEAFTLELVAAAQQNSAFVPAERSAADIEKRRAATVALTQRAVRCANLARRLSDTARVAGDGTVGASLDLYHILRRLGDAEGLDATVDRLTRRFGRRPAKKSDSTPSTSSQPATESASNITAMPTAPAVKAA